MAAKKRGLGRGLDALLGGVDSGEEQKQSPASASSLPIDLIGRGRFQPRRNFDEDKLRELADSIAAQGVVQPVVVRPVEGGRYELIAGERRWRASQLAGLSDIPAVIREVDDQTAMAMGLIENIQRDDLNPLEEAQALHRLTDEFALTHQEVADAVGRSRASVSNLLRLLDLNPEVKALIDQGKLEMGHARALLGLKGALQSEAAAKVAAKGLSVRETEVLVRKLSAAPADGAAPKTKAVVEDPDVKRLLTDLSERIGAQVQLKQGSAGKGQLIISYNSLDELDGILGHIR
jgi:ParB family chromosome partitioning protein